MLNGLGPLLFKLEKKCKATMIAYARFGLGVLTTLGDELPQARKRRDARSSIAPLAQGFDFRLFQFWPGGFHLIARVSPNDQHQRREPAATERRVQAELNGWLPSAACWG